MAQPQPTRTVVYYGDKESRDEAEKVRRWRHNIQKELIPSDKHLNRRGPLSSEVAQQVDIWFKEVEAYDEMTVISLAYSRIGPVMRHVSLLDAESLPQSIDEDFKFRDRARRLIDRWQSELDLKGRKSRASLSSPMTDYPIAKPDSGAQTAQFIVGAPPPQFPLGSRDRPANFDFDADEQGDTDARPTERVLDTAPRPYQEDPDISVEHQIPPALEPSLSRTMGDSQPSTHVPHEQPHFSDSTLGTGSSIASRRNALA